MNLSSIRFLDACARTLGVELDEAKPTLIGFSMLFLLFAAYFMLRPVRETMGITGGVKNLQWLFTGTFVATMAAMPLFGWLASKIARRRVLYWTYGFFAINLIAFGVAFGIRPSSILLARMFYIWLSVFSLVSVSVAWSLLADLFRMAEAKRLFAIMAAGASAGGLAGPLVGVLVVGRIGNSGLLMLSAILLIGAIGTASRLQAWRDSRSSAHVAAMEASAHKPLGGSPMAGASLIFGSRILFGSSIFVLLLASTTTFLYFEQARLVAEAFPDQTQQTRVFSLIDSIVQVIAIVTQIFVTGRVAQRVGLGVLLVAVPLVVALGFVWLAFAPSFAALAVVMVIRRAGEYALVRPGREILFTAVDAESKYKAKNFIDTVVYRASDAVSGWLKASLEVLAQQPFLAATVGAVLALLWAATGAWLAGINRRSTSHERCLAPA